MKGTGRRLGGPGVDLVELVDGGGVKHGALVVEPAHRDHPSLHGDLEFGIGFMEQPEVTGLMRLVAHSPDEGAFLYPTGTVWSIAEIVRELASAGETGGVKAALELCYMAGEILVEASDQSAHSGLARHGSVDPWKLVLRPDGQVSIIGYGLPRPQIEAWLDDERRLPSEDALRYCAPEELKADGEPDLGSDLFALSLVALELMVGRPVYDGLVSDVKQQAMRGEAARKLYQWRDRIPTPVREVLGRALKPDTDTRFRDGLDYVYSVHDLLGGIDGGDGPSLRELVTTVRARQKRGVAAVGGQTGALSREELALLAADIDDEGVATELPRPRKPRPDAVEEGGEKPRWKRVSRNRGAAGEETPSPRRRGRRAQPVSLPASETTVPPPLASPQVSATANARAEADSARDRLLRRLRDRGQPAGSRSEPTGRVESVEPTTAAPTEAEPEASSRSSRRRRPGGRAAALLERLRSSSAETVAEAPPKRRRRGGDAPAPEPEVVEAAPEPVAPTRSSRRRADPAGVTLAPEATQPPRPPQRPAGRRVRSAEPVAPTLVVEDLSPEDPDRASEVPTEALSTRDATEILVSWEGRVVMVGRGTHRAGELAEQAARQLFLPSVDALGGRVAAYRLCTSGRTVGPEVEASTLPPAVELRRLPNQPRLVTVVDPEGTRARVALGEAVPMDDLKPVLAGLFGLSEDFRLHAVGRDLGGREVLADHDVVELEIRR